MAELNTTCFECDACLLPKEIHFRTADPGLQPEQVFEQPDASDAVNGWDGEGDSGDLGIAVTDNPLPDLGGIQIKETGGRQFGRNSQPRLFVQAVIVGQSIAGEEVKNGKTSIAAKQFIRALETFPAAPRAVVKTEFRLRAGIQFLMETGAALRIF